jgi:ABC-2 type transport system permease protein
MIREGRMNQLLLRPLHPIFDAFAQEIAGKVVYLALDVPVVMILALILKPDLNPHPEQIPAFILALLMAWLLRFFWGYALALLAFWATRASALLPIQDTLIFLLAGQVAPVMLLPGPVNTLAVLQPFRYMVGFPVEILTGQLDASGITLGLAIQAGWLAAALVLSGVTWIQGVKRYSAVGG